MECLTTLLCTALSRPGRSPLADAKMALQPTHDAPVTQAIANDAFYGDLELGDFQERYRIPASVAPLTMAPQLELAVDECNAALATWQAVQVAAGVANLAALDALSKPPGAPSRYYTEAVYARAYGHLIPLLVTLYFTDQADGIEEELAQNEARFFERSNRFLGRLMGQPDDNVTLL